MTLEDIERRAKARGWSFNRGNGQTTIYDETGAELCLWVSAGGSVWPRRRKCDDLTLCYLEGYPEALALREGAARVLSVVSQVAAMEWAYRIGAEIYDGVSDG